MLILILSRFHLKFLAATTTEACYGKSLIVGSNRDRCLTPKCTTRLRTGKNLRIVFRLISSQKALIKPVAGILINFFLSFNRISSLKLFYFRFYTLLVLSTALFNKPPFKNLIVNGLVLASDGQKMSKKKKNYPDPMLVSLSCIVMF